MPKRPGTERERATYASFADVRKVNPEEGCIIDLHHFDPEHGAADAARFLFSTQRGGIHMWDLRMAQTVWMMKGEAKHGLLTATALDETRGQWMVSATARGVMTVGCLERCLLE
jgi:phosphoinositide-3-kinase regulatory subunit 4